MMCARNKNMVLGFLPERPHRAGNWELGPSPQGHWCHPICVTSIDWLRSNIRFLDNPIMPPKLCPSLQRVETSDSTIEAIALAIEAIALAIEAIALAIDGD
jgi:hypothetical protein